MRFKLFVILLFGATMTMAQGSAYTAYEQVYSQPTTFYSQTGHRLTAAPEGYKPFYVSTYMRHGSRWLISARQYDRPIQLLAEADSARMLTRTGKGLLADLRRARELSPNDKLGVLTRRGFEQHDSIATRLWRNFPEVFDRSAQIIARSSAVPRCVKSMAQEVETLQRLSGIFFIRQESGTPELQEAMAPSHAPMDIEPRLRAAMHRADSLNHAFREQHIPTERIRNAWFRHGYDISERDLQDLIRNAWDVATDEQSLDGAPDLYRYFSDEEQRELWRCKNVGWYVGHANAPQTDGLAPYKEVALLRDFLDEYVDSTNWHGATLRFGHDGCLMPLCCLMQIEEVNRAVADLDTLDRVWRDFEVVPMAGNVQVVFYRQANPQSNGDVGVLVKVLLNEREVHLPLRAVNEVYYPWTEVKRLWLSSALK